MEKKVTIKDIARLAETSKTTVSFYLSGQYQKMSEETRSRIEQVIRQTHYIPSANARRLRQSRSHLIGVIVGDLGNVFTSRMVKGVDQAAQQAGCQMIVGSSGYHTENEKILMEQMMKLNVDGFVIQPTSGFHALLEEFKAYGKPFVFMDSPLEEEGYPIVKSDAIQAVCQAMEIMAQKGYERFLMISADPSVLKTRMDRIKGFGQVMERMQTPSETWIVEDGVTPDEISVWIEGHVHPDEKTLIFVPNCWLLPIVYQGLSAWKKQIPDMIGLLGFDNTEWISLASPSVSSIVQPGFEEGQAACRILLEWVENKEGPSCEILPCTLVENESTAL